MQTKLLKGNICIVNYCLSVFPYGWLLYPARLVLVGIPYEDRVFATDKTPVVAAPKAPIELATPVAPVAPCAPYIAL